MNKVIVIGGFHHNTYGLIRSLGEAGIKSYVILEPCHPKMNWLFVSKYIINGSAIKRKNICFIRV